ncbi:MAG: hypothetical protein QOE44_420 [Solirubrobacteraceae bacterium]|nr:hypothetical protein [Solirubrobacteraceae bacterium]
MDGNEHRAIGDAAFGASPVNVGGESAKERFWLSFGEVMALSGDYFAPGAGGNLAAAPVEDLFSLARVPGSNGTRLHTRDELVCALKVMSVDEGFVDWRFEPGGEFAGFRFSALASSSIVERRVRDRYLELAATNDEHFVAPGGVTDDCLGRPGGSAGRAYRRLHEVALEEARRLGHGGGDQSRAMAREAAAQHFLTDAFTAGHLRTPVAAIRRYWHSRYPAFWENLQREVASSTAWTLRERSRPIRVLPAPFLYDSTLSALRTRTSGYPELSVGDFLARLFHDWDNSHGLEIEGGGVVFGDGHIDQGVTTEVALVAVRAGIDDVAAAFELGVSGSTLTGEALYRAVRGATGAPEGSFLAETMTPRPTRANPPQNWWATDLDTLWDTPIVGTAGPTVGEALADMLDRDGYFIRQLDRLGQGLADPSGLLAVPILGAWLSRKGRQAYHHGFIEPLAAHPKRMILAVVHANAPASATPGSAGLQIDCGAQRALHARAS